MLASPSHCSRRVTPSTARKPCVISASSVRHRLPGGRVQFAMGVGELQVVHAARTGITPRQCAQSSRRPCRKCSAFVGVELGATSSRTSHQSAHAVRARAVRDRFRSPAWLSAIAVIAPSARDSAVLPGCMRASAARRIIEIERDNNLSARAKRIGSAPRHWPAVARARPPRDRAQCATRSG